MKDLDTKFITEEEIPDTNEKEHSSAFDTRGSCSC